ncbi:hypothetical protein ACFLT7_07625 [candidate division KSB1 bacterium]
MSPGLFKRMSLGKWLVIIYVASLLMSNGPGVLLVNRPVLILGLPLIYIWAIFWWLFQMTLVLIAYFRVWKPE